MDFGSAQRLRQYLEDARFEVLPVRGVLEQVSSLPAGTTVTVTSSPAKGMRATVDVAGRLRERGYRAVPHLAARLVTGPGHLDDLLGRMRVAGLDEVFVIAGDAPTPAGPYPDALALLRAMEEIGARPPRVGITGYPERHAFLSDATTTQFLFAKAEHADYIVSQICFDPHAIGTWLASVRDRGVTLPVYIGLAGAVDASKLLRMSLKIGLGDSMRFLRKQHVAVGTLLSSYSPDELFDTLGPYLLDTYYGVAGWHLFTFNEVARTQRARDDAADRIEEVPA